MRVRITIPASAGNTGPAFDSLGIAFGLFNEVIFDTSLPEGSVEIEGEAAQELLKEKPNLVQRAMERFAARTGKKVPAGGLRLVNRIPLWRGLGSSAAAVAGGLLAADAASGAKMTREELLRIAVPMEGHPDNVAPALFGGAVLTVLDAGDVEGPLTIVPFRLPSDWKAVLYVPDLIIPTKRAREILPQEVPRRDAVFNHSRVGLLVAAITQGRPELLRTAMQDRLHQPYRSRIFPPMGDLIGAAVEAGAWGACLSGAGSSILALASGERIAASEAAMGEKARRLGVAGKGVVLDIPGEGARVEILE
jgi:homoserine kinase